MRRVVTFACEGDRLVATLDAADGTTGVLIVSGGNEIRCGAHRGMAMLAQALAAAGVSVFRFDRRGVGDSGGENRGYAESGPDIAAALAAFRRKEPRLTRIVAFGNCDAATALVLLGEGIDALVLANPWLGDEDAAPPPAAIRSHFARRLLTPKGWRKLLDLSALASQVRQAFGRRSEQPLTRRVAARLGRLPTTIVLAKGDRTAQVFSGAITPPSGIGIVEISSASHSFADRGDALAQVLIDVAIG